VTTSLDAGIRPEAPSARRRALAVASLGCLSAAAVVVALLLLRTPMLLVGGLLGLAVVVGGAWWLVTESGWRRWAGVATIAVGALLVGGAILTAFAESSQAGVPRLLIVIGLMVATGATARAAMVRDLHLEDERASPHVRPRHPVLICNPRSGGGKVASFDLVRLAEDLGVEVLVLEPGLDLAELARSAVAGGADCLGMAGGDGSQALVASVAIAEDIPFVCISAGTRNHFALDLGLDRDDPRTGLIALVDGVERAVDYATVGDRLFVNNVSLGIYATVVQEDGYRDAKVETSMARLPEMLGRQATPFDLQFTASDGSAVDGAFLILVSNNPYVLGPSLDISQRRAMDTGLLGVFAITAETGVQASRLVARAAIGQADRDPNVHQFATPEFEVRSRSGHAYLGVDGERLDLATPLRFASHPGGLRLLVPPENLGVAERRRARSVDARALWAIALGRPPANPGAGR
jgi:diacylglycerol kinase family enzyme